MDMDPDSHVRDMIEKYVEGRQSPIKPELVDTGPCKENILLGDDVDLLEISGADDPRG